MADNVVETILVKLGLDSGQYNAATDKVIKKNETLNKSVGQTDKIVGTVAKTMGRWFAGIASATGVAKLIDEVQKLNDELYHLEKNLGMSSTTIKAWQGAAGAMGGSADGMTSSMKSLNMAMNDFVVMGDSSMLPYMNALGVSMVDAQGKLRDTDKVMLDLADSFSKMDREQAFSLATKMGIDEGTFNTLVQGRQEMEKMIEYQKTMYKSSEAELQASRDLAKNRALLGQHWESMKTLMANALIPFFVKLSEVALGMFDYLQKHQKAIQAVFKGIAFVVGVVLTPILVKATMAALAFIAPFAPFILVVGALGAAFGLLYDDYKAWAEGGNSLFNWGAFRDYIDNATLSTDNLKNAFKNLTKDMLSSTIPTLKGYADIVKLLAQGEFKAAGALAASMLGNLGEKIGNTVDDLTGNTQGSFIESVGNLLFGGGKGGSSPAVSQKGWKLGQTSSQFETGGRGAGTISSGKGDRGGASYGSYQMSSKLGVVQDFLKQSGYGKHFAGMGVNSKGFNAKWKELAASDAGFASAQHDYIKRTHYDVLMKKLNKAGLGLDSRGAAVQDAIWSTSVQFGGSTSLINKALAGKDVSNMSDEQIVRAIQQYKAANTEKLFKSSPTQWKGLRNRAKQEEAALVSLSQAASSAQGSMRQGSGAIPSNMQSANRNVRNDVNIGDINVYTTASTIKGTTTDAMTAATNQLGMLMPSMA